LRGVKKWEQIRAFEARQRLQAGKLSEMRGGKIRGKKELTGSADAKEKSARKSHLFTKNLKNRRKLKEGKSIEEQKWRRAPLERKGDQLGAGKGGTRKFAVGKKDQGGTKGYIRFSTVIRRPRSKLTEAEKDRKKIVHVIDKTRHSGKETSIGVAGGRGP